MANVENGALQAAINNAAVGETVALTSNITVTSRITVSNVVTIDLNGYVISGDVNDGYGAIYIGTKGALTIVDSSPDKTGGIINTVGNAIGNYGSVIIYDGTFTGNYALYNFYYNETIYGTSVIYGGTFKSVNDGSPSIANCGDLTINGGTIESIDTTNILNITNGIIESLHIGTADYNPPMQNTSINGGHIDVLVVDDGSSNEIAISGGTFGVEIDEKYLTDGYEISYDEGTGTYGAISNSDNEDVGLKVIATSSSRIRDLVIKNGQLIFIKDLKRIAFDFNNTRTFYNQIVEIDTEVDRQNLENPLSGYYFVIGTACLWRYKNGWIQITEKPKEIVFIGIEFPELGQQGKLYVNTTDGNEHISVWDDDTDSYKVVADKTQTMTPEEVIALFN